MNQKPHYDPDCDPDIENKWLANHERMRTEIDTSEVEFFAELRRRKARGEE